ncbi:MAG: PH domain-containing protein [Deltaproteobacteria bacterium]|nr:PH domain-containing protein [Deltaproteobacteria bacterium]
METTTYTTRRVFLIPFSLAFLLLLVLLILSAFDRTFPPEIVILALICVPILYILLESAWRRTTIGPDGVRIRKLFRERHLLWADITNIDVLAVRKKVYLLLTTTKGFHALANSHGNFSSLVRDIVGHVDPEKIEGGVRDLIEHPVVRISDVVSSWIAVGILLGAILLKVVG